MCKKLSKNEEMLLKLSRYSLEYETMEKQKVEYYEKHTKVDRTVVFTLYHQQVYIDSITKKICTLVDKLRRENVTIDNPLHKDFSKLFHKGLF